MGPWGPSGAPQALRPRCCCCCCCSWQSQRPKMKKSGKHQINKYRRASHQREADIQQSQNQRTSSTPSKEEL